MMCKNKLSLLITTFLLITLCSTLSAMDCDEMNYDGNKRNTEQQKYVMKPGEQEKLDELNNASNQYKDYMALNKDLRDAAKNDLQQVIIMLLSRPEVSKNRNIISEINRTVFSEAAKNGHINLAKRSFDNFKGTIQNSDNRMIENVFSGAAKNGHDNILEWLFSVCANRIDKSCIDFTLTFALRTSNTNIIRCLLNQNDELRPSETAIIAAYREAFAERNNEIVELLAPHVQKI